MSLQLQRGRGTHAAGNMTQQNAVRIPQAGERERDSTERKKRSCFTYIMVLYWSLHRFGSIELHYGTSQTWIFFFAYGRIHAVTYVKEKLKTMCDEKASVAIFVTK